MGLKIEQLGLCGAGKTTFLNNLAPKIQSELNLKISYPVKPSSIRIILTLFKIVLIGLISEPIVFSKFILIAENWWLLKKIAYRHAGIVKRSNEDSILADSGILQPFISFEIEKNLSDTSIPIRCLLRGCPLPDIIINFHISPITAKERYELRGLRGEGQLIRENSENYFHRAEELHKRLISYCEEKKIYIIDIDPQYEFTDKYLKDKLLEIRKVLTEEKKEYEEIL